MKTIYSSAQRVLIWLGPPQNDSDFVIDALRTGHLDSLNLLRFTDSLELLLRRSWFGRVWIAQELTLSSQSPTVHVGFQTISWDAFSVAIRSVWTRLCAKEEPPSTGGSQYLECFTKIAIWRLGDAVYPPALEARAEVVQQLIDMRNSGPSTPFSQQFFRTIYLQAKDSRDKVFGLLGFSSFKRSPITADYTKPISRVFAEAAATIMQDDFYTYIDLQLWSYRILSEDRWANWVPDLLSFRVTERHKKSWHAPQPHALKECLERAHGTAPIIDFSADFRTFSTVGTLMGTIVASKRGLICDEPWESDVRNTGPGISLDQKKTLFTSLRQKSIHESNSEGTKLATKTFTWSTQVFMTNSGLLGATTDINWPLRNISDGQSIVAGLFGIDIPFVLSPTKDGKYQLQAVAYIEDHVLGNKHIEGLKPGQDWRDLVKEGKLQTFTIV
jgi:hypothetical protein